LPRLLRGWWQKTGLVVGRRSTPRPAVRGCGRTAVTSACRGHSFALLEENSDFPLQLLFGGWVRRPASASGGRTHGAAGRVHSVKGKGREPGPPAPRSAGGVERRRGFLRADVHSLGSRRSGPVGRPRVCQRNRTPPARAPDQHVRENRGPDTRWVSGGFGGSQEPRSGICTFSRDVFQGPSLGTAVGTPPGLSILVPLHPLVPGRGVAQDQTLLTRPRMGLRRWGEVQISGGRRRVEAR